MCLLPARWPTDRPLEKHSFRPTQSADSCSTVCRIEKDSDGTFTVTYKGKSGEERQINTDLVMFGTGRSPATQHMGLEVSLCLNTR